MINFISIFQVSSELPVGSSAATHAAKSAASGNGIMTSLPQSTTPGGSGSNVPNGTFTQIYLITIQYIDQMAFNVHKNI